MKMVDNRECFRQLNLMAARGWVASKPAVSRAIAGRAYIPTGMCSAGIGSCSRHHDSGTCSHTLAGYYSHCLTTTSTS